MATWYNSISPGAAGSPIAGTLSASGLLQSGGGGIFAAWGGGVLTQTGVYNGASFVSGPAMVVFGGGHTDYGGDELYSIAGLSGNTPFYLRLRDQASPFPTNVDADGSGNPVARHSYQTIQWIGGSNNWLFSSGYLFRYNDAGGSSVAHYADLNTASPNSNQLWSTKASQPDGAADISVWDSVNNRLWAHAQSQNEVSYYDPAGNSWQSALFKSPLVGSNAHSAIDTKRNLWFAVWAGATTVQGYITTDTAFATDYYTVSTTGTAPTSANAKSIVWDPVDDRFVVWAGGNTLYFLTPPASNPGQGGSAWTWSSQTFTGSTVSAVQTNGTFGRFAFVPYPIRGYLLWVDESTAPFFFRPTSATLQPIITAQPTQASVATGATAGFSVTATSTGGSLTYQWQSALRVDLYSNTPGTWADIGGATSSSYTTGALASSGDGTWYRVKVTDDNGTSTSLPARAFLNDTGSAGKAATGLAFGGSALMMPGRTDYRRGWMALRKRQAQGDTADGVAALASYVLPAAQSLSMAAFATGTASSTASLTTGIALAAAATGQATATAALAAPAAAMQAAATAQATATAALTTAIRLAAAGVGTAASTAAMATGVQFAAAASAGSVSSAAITTGIALSASAIGTATASAALAAASAAMAAAAAGRATATASLSTGIPLQAACAGAATAGASITTGLQLAGQAQGGATAAAALTTGIPLVAAAQGTATSSAALTTQPQGFFAAGSGSASASAALTTGIRLSAAATGAASAMAALTTTPQTLSAAAVGGSTATAALTTGVRMQGAATAASTATAAMTTAVLLQAQAQATSVASASLTTAGAAWAAATVARAQSSAALTTAIYLQAVASATARSSATLSGAAQPLSTFFAYDVPSVPLLYDVPTRSLAFDIPSIGGNGLDVSTTQ